MFFGRPYWNLGAVKRCLAKLPGFVERRFDEDLAIEVQYEGAGMETPVSAAQRDPRAPGDPRHRPAAETAGRGSIDAFLAAGFDAIERKYDPLPADVDRSFRELVEQDYLTTEVNYFRTIFCASLAKLDFTDSFPQADYGQLVAALPEMRHLAPTRAIREMAHRQDRCGRARCGDSAITAAASSTCARRAGMKTGRSSSSSWRATGASAGDDPTARVRGRARTGAGGVAVASAAQLRAQARSAASVRVAARGDARPVDAALLPHPPARARDRAAARPRRRHLLHDLPGDHRRRPTRTSTPEPGGVRELSQLQGAE